MTDRSDAPDRPLAADPAPNAASAERGPAPPPGALPGALPDLGDLIRQGEWRRALAVSRLTQAHPEVQEALGALCGVQDAVRARRYPAARQNLADYRAALNAAQEGELLLLRARVGPDGLEAALSALDAQHRAKEADPAGLERALAPALEHPLTRADALNMRAVLHAALSDSGPARTLLTQALEADPGHYRALTNLGNLDLEAGDLTSAEARYRQAIALNDQYDGAHHNLGVVLRRRGRVAESVSAIRRGQRLSLRRTREDTRAEVKEQFRATPALKVLRFVLLAALALVIFLVWRGQAG